MDIENGIDKPTENWTRFPNSILDNLDQFEPNEFKVLAFVIRKNLGWRDRANRRFAVRYVAARLNMADRTAWAAIQGLETKGLIHCIDRERSGLRLYEVTWKTPKKSRRVRAVAKNATRQRFAENATEPLQKMHTVLETKVKETSNANALHLHPSPFKESKTNKKKAKPKIELVHSEEALSVLIFMKNCSKQDLKKSKSAKDHIDKMLEEYEVSDICKAYFEFCKDGYWRENDLPLVAFKKQFEKYHAKAMLKAESFIPQEDRFAMNEDLAKEMATALSNPA